MESTQAYIKTQFIGLVQKRGGWDNDKFHRKVVNFEHTYLSSPIWGEVSYTDYYNPELKLFPNYMIVNIKSWHYWSSKYNTQPGVGIGTHSLRPRRPRGDPVPTRGRGSTFETG